MNDNYEEDSISEHADDGEPTGPVEQAFSADFILIIVTNMTIVVTIVIIITIMMLMMKSKPASLLHSLLPTFQQLLKASNPLFQQFLWQP